MGLLDKLKKGRTRRGQKEKQHQKQPFQQNLSQKTDPAICPGGAFMVQLFMKEKSEMPSKEMFAEILSKHLGKTEQLGDCESHAGFIVHDYISETNDDTLPVMLLISECAEFEPNSIDDFRRGQMWDCLSDRDRILSECKYQISLLISWAAVCPQRNAQICLWTIWRHWWNYILSARQFTTLTPES